MMKMCHFNFKGLFILLIVLSNIINSLFQLLNIKFQISYLLAFGFP